MKNQLYDQLHSLFSSITDSLSNTDSWMKGPLAVYFSQTLECIFYGNLVNNFYYNLNSENLSECGLSNDCIAKIKRKHKKMQKEVRSVLAGTSSGTLVDESFYNNFKAKVQYDFPAAFRLILEIEREIDIDYAKKYIEDKKQEIRGIWEPEADLISILAAGAFIAFIENQKRLPPSLILINH